MTPARRSGPSDEFRAGLEGVEPRPEDPRGAPAQGRDRKAPAVRADQEPSQTRFEHPDPHEPRLGAVSGVSARTLKQLRSGKLRPDSEIDLHGLEAREARAALAAGLAQATGRGERCVVVIHGRGARSPGAPVLKAALPGWLGEAGIAERVLAFAPAVGHDGGEGATALLLVRAR